MGWFTQIPEDTFTGLQLEAGVLLNKFDPMAPAKPADEDIICATTGGIQASCTAEYSDLGEDVDNCPVNMKELKHLDSWACVMSFTSISNSPEGIRLALGAADIKAETGAIVPRRDLEQSDFSDIWWVGDRADGGYVAIQLMNALSTGGYSLQTTKSGKGQTSCELTGHVSIHDQDTMPMVFYSADIDEPTPETPSVTLDKETDAIAVDGETTLLATTVPATVEVTWSSSDDTVATVEGGVVTGVAEGEAVITASITVDGVEYTDTCTVTVTA